ncbi:MAG TPA: hypothetical protein VNO70_25955, partial [Blastocatellia bacterium]|nr:hypothetical protein [Blastocatellia bacterium]
QPTEPPRPKSLRPAAPPNIAFFTLAPPLRGVGQMATIAIPADADYAAIQLELESGAYPAYRVELRAQPGNQVVWRSGRLRARARGDGRAAVVVSLRPGLLKSQRYTLEVSGISGDGAAEIVGGYPFRVIRE